MIDTIVFWLLIAVPGILIGSWIVEDLKRQRWFWRMLPKRFRIWLRVQELKKFARPRKHYPWRFPDGHR